MKRYCPECETAYDDARCFILCPHELRAAPHCQFCPEPPADQRCSWPTEAFRTVKYADLKPGDIVRRAIERLKNRPPATVAHIAPWFLDSKDSIPAGLQILLRIRQREKKIQVRGCSPVQALRPQPCGAAVCEFHLRQVADNAVYCADHWRSWEAL